MECRTSGPVVLVSARLRGVNPEEVLQNLEEGLTAEIVFQFRLYRETSGFRSIFGDQLLLERKVVRQAYFDRFEDRFVMKTQGEGIGEEMKHFSLEVEFLSSFFTLEDYRLSGQLEQMGGPGLYVLARISLKPVRIVFPLNIISLFTDTDITTPWIESTLAGQQGSAF